MPQTRAPKLPDFIIAGDLTSGATSLYQCLHQHPQVYTCPIKKPTFSGAADLSAWLR